MAEIKKVATRESYGATLAELASEYPNLVVLDADLAGATKTANFKKVCPERFIDCGIAEGNMMGVAAGLAAAGMIPFASSFAMFAAGRAFEQVRNSIGYPHLNVKIGATHAGISVGEDGATHQCCEDIALMRSIPGMVVINPADDVEARAAVRAAVEYVGPVYLRFGRMAVPVFNDPENYHFELGKGIVLREGMPQGRALPQPPAPPAELVLDKAPSMLPVSRLVFADSDAEADEFYSAACTALAHGVGQCRALLHGSRPVCTVGCYEQSENESYMAAGVTAPDWQGRGLARWLIVGLANDLAARRTVRFACFPELCGFYSQLGFIQNGKMQYYTTDWTIE